MLKPGDKVRITTIEDSDQVLGYGYVVIEYDGGLLKTERGEKTIIFNMRSTSFHSVEVEK